MMSATPLAAIMARSSHAEDQLVPWFPARWLEVPSGASSGRRQLAQTPVLQRLSDLAGSGGLCRSDIIAVAEEPIDLLIASMVWGFGTLGVGPARVARMLETDAAADIAADIVTTVRTKGAGHGFSALFKANGRGRIYGLAVAMGPKLMYFACRGLSPCPSPQPMIYDQWVFAGLKLLPSQEQPRLPSSGKTLPTPKSRVSQEAYQTWCQWAADRASDHGVRPEDVEYALFREGNPAT